MNLIALLERFIVAVEKLADANARMADGCTFGVAPETPAPAEPKPAEEKKRGRPKKDAAPVEEPKVEAPVEEPKVEEPKAEDTQPAEDHKAEEPKAEAPAAASKDEAKSALKTYAVQNGREAAVNLIKEVSGCDKLGDVEELPNAGELFALMIARTKG